MVSSPTGEAINAVFRDEVGLICGSLVRMTGDFDLAEDLVQDAVMVALSGGRSTACPTVPRHGCCRPRGGAPSTVCAVIRPIGPSSSC